MLERAFQFVISDDRFMSGRLITFGHLVRDELTPAAKRFVVEVYEHFTKKRLLDDESYARWPVEDTEL